MTVPDRADRLAAAVETILLTAWVGGLWFAGLVAAPRLFSVYPSELAGDVAGLLFTLVFWLGLPAAAMTAGRVLAARGGSRPWRLDASLVLVMLLSALVIELVLHPLIAGMRDAGERGAMFGIAHGASSLLYLGNCLLGAVLVVRRLRASA